MKKISIYIICTIWLVIDQIIKNIVISYLNVGEKITIISNLFQINYLQNEGAAFSSFTGMRVLLILITITAFYMIASYIKKNEITSKLEMISLGIILGGILGNLIDRVSFGYVIDYLSFTIFGYQFAVFNFADIGIVVGIFLLIILLLRRKENAK